MQVKNIYKMNILFTVLYFVACLGTTIYTKVKGIVNLDNGLVRTLLCLFIGAIMVFIAVEQYHTNKSIFDEKVKDTIIIIWMVLFNFFLLLAMILFVYESIASKKTGAPSMAMGVAASNLLIVLNHSIEAIHKESSKNTAL